MYFILFTMRGLIRNVPCEIAGEWQNHSIVSSNKSLPDPDLEIRGGGHPDP